MLPSCVKRVEEKKKYAKISAQEWVSESSIAPTRKHKIWNVITSECGYKNKPRQTKGRDKTAKVKETILEPHFCMEKLQTGC